MKKAGVTISAEAQQRMEKLWDCYAWVQLSRTSRFRLSETRTEHLLSRRSPAAVPPNYVSMFNRPDLLYINTQGKEGKMPEQTSRAFSDCGWYIMRSPWDTKPYTDARQMFFKASTTQGHGQRRSVVVHDVRLRQGDPDRSRQSATTACR